MPRYFIEVCYRGTCYSGFQVQQNAVTIQSEVEKALQIYFRQAFALTGSSRTDAGVHALQNYFHFDTDIPFEENLGKVYNLNAILPNDIVIKRIFHVGESAHCRFDAIAREYKYFIYQDKNPFLFDRAYYFPYNLDIDRMNKAATLLLQHRDFTSFSKKNTQVNNFICDIQKSEWIIENDTLIYQVISNRFLRGMVKGLVGTMLRVGTGKISLNQFTEIINTRDCSNADFSVPPQALFLIKVSYNNF
ncbi:MAG: tRNA pseudouridine(38-40) synthase TruA [Bacteroidota bacterium]|nr:tRNA pseudouridine(38-40) synthase TruA [Bacteroidota bacterium]